MLPEEFIKYHSGCAPKKRSSASALGGIAGVDPILLAALVLHGRQIPDETRPRSIFTLSSSLVTFFTRCSPLHLTTILGDARRGSGSHAPCAAGSAKWPILVYLCQTEPASGVAFGTT
jgi:hypothetical protein